MGDSKPHTDSRSDSLQSPHKATATRQLFMLQLWINGLAFLLPIAGLIVVLLYCNTLSTSIMQTFGPSAMVAGATLIAGAFLGFLFAIPRAQQQGERIDGRPVAEQANRQGPLRINTNLEQVSDWLTKIIVGVTLIELGRIVRSLGPPIAALAAVYGNATGATVMAAAIFLYFPIVGFLSGYVATRSLITVLFEIVPHVVFDISEEELDRSAERVASRVVDQMAASKNSVSEAPSRDDLRNDVDALPVSESVPVSPEGQRPKAPATERDRSLGPL